MAQTAGNQVAPILVQASCEQIQITEAHERNFALSDRCPIAIRMNLVSSGGPTPETTAEELLNEIRALVRKKNEKVKQLHQLIPALKQ